MGFLRNLFGKKAGQDSASAAPIPDATLDLMGFKQDFRGLGKALKHPNVETRQHALVAIGIAGKISAQGGGNMHFSADRALHPEAIKLLIAALGDSEASVRDAAAKELESSQSAEAKAALEKYRSRPATTPAKSVSAGSGQVAELGILFNIDDLGGGFYGWHAYKIIFAALDPEKLTGCTLYDGDTTETLQGGARDFCIAIQGLDAAKLTYVREMMAARNDTGLLPVGKRFIEGNITQQHPLVLEGEIDGAGKLHTRKGAMIAGQSWAEGTKWTIIAAPNEGGW